MPDAEPVSTSTPETAPSGASGGSSQPRSGARPAVISHAIRDRQALYMAYMPFLINGGIFVPGQREGELGDEVFLLLSLPDDEHRYPVAGKIAWITPPGSTRIEGIGVHFGGDDSGKRLKKRIEDVLGTLLAADQPTHTL